MTLVTPALLAGCCAMAAAQSPLAMHPDSPVVKDFDRRIAAYVKLHN